MPKPRYQKLDHIDHVLHRPDTYLGSIRMRKLEEYVAVKENDEYRLELTEIESSPALLRIFVEPLSNALDNVARSKKTRTKCTKIKVTIDPKTGRTSVWNDGDVVPIEKNDQEDCYNHSMIFGQLMTGSNYDDDEDRDGSGRNGLGVKLCNIYSTYFRVCGLDPKKKKTLIQEWSDNMKKTDGPDVKACAAGLQGYTEVTWIPDFTRFGIKGYTNDLIRLYTRYVIDAAMLSKVDVFLNDEIIPISSLQDYAKLYVTPTDEQLYIKTKEAEVLVTPSGGNYQHISFVNGVYTRLGGLHVDSWTEGLLRPLVDKFNGKSKSKAKKPTINIRDVKQFFRIFVNATVNRPEFNSQDKEKLEAPAVEIEIKKTYISSLNKWSVIDDIEDIIRGKEMAVLKKAERGRKKNVKVPGYDPANNAGGRNSDQCILILCEGLSAKTYAVAGIEQGVYGKQGRDWFGIYPLTGKIKNVRNSAPTTIAANKVITNLIQIMGLKYDVDYRDDKNFKTLGYGKIMIMTDADSVSGDTPILLKDSENIFLSTVDNLGSKWIVDTNNGKEYATVDFDYKVWTEKGWTEIKSVMRHKVSKNMYRIVTHTGIVDVTEDHSLISKDGNKITPVSCNVGDELLHSFPSFVDNNHCSVSIENLSKLSVKQLLKLASLHKIRYYQTLKKEELVFQLTEMLSKPCENLGKDENDDITLEMAYTMGLFFTDGNCGIYEWEYKKKPKGRPNIYTFKRKSYSWAISNTNLIFLTRAKEALDMDVRDFGNHMFSIIEDRTHQKRGYYKAYKLILNGGKDTENYIKLWRDMFYDRKYKKIPTIILNSDRPIREAFFEGMYDGDGDKKSGATRIDVFHKIGAQSVFLLCKSLGYEVSVNCMNDKPDVYTLVLTKGHQQANPIGIKKIIDMGKTEQYVYDLETENHHFQAGIGQLIVHNTDGIHIEGLIMNFFHSLFPTVMLRREPFIVSMKTPIARVFVPRKDDLLFYDERRFRNYLDKQKKKVNAKYYKGLGTTKPEDVPDTFGLKMVEYVHDEKTSANMNKVFHTKYADARKDWLGEYTPESYAFSLDDVGQSVQMSMSNFLDREMIKFSHDDCKRSIPNAIDGLKESQRKIIYAARKRNLKHNGPSLKVAQFGAYTAEHSEYHHGENNLYQTIVKMANEFPGTNNIPLLYRDGMFGCVDPSTPILLWNGATKLAKDIVVGDELIGDDGKKRLVSKLINGVDQMFTIKQGYGDDYKVNSCHILTLKYSMHKVLSKYKNNWKLLYFDTKTNSPKSKQVYFKDEYNCDKAYEKIKKFMDYISEQDIFDINIRDYLSYSKYHHRYFKSVKNDISVSWDHNETTIDPYILGMWLGDGDKNGRGFSSMDEELVKEWVIYADKIGCEVLHTKNGQDHENYHYKLRRRSGGQKTGKYIALGEPDHSSKTCIGCLTSKISHPACDWIYNGKSHEKIDCYTINSSGVERYDGNPFIQLLKHDGLVNNKYIPVNYIINDTKTRLELLAGMIDTDGRVRQVNNGVQSIKISQEKNTHGHIITALQYIARSLGWRAEINETVSNKHSIMLNLIISGDNLDRIPTRLPRKKLFNNSQRERNRLSCNFEIIPDNIGEFVGWHIDGNERFLLGDFTVTHNTRLEGGDDAASARYIFTKMDALTEYIFRAEDDPLLTPVNVDGNLVEPEHYVPILPMLLVNGCTAGIGTGWSCNVPCFNPMDIVNCIKIWIEHEGEVMLEDPDDRTVCSLLPDITPWYRGFKGEIEKDSGREGRYITYGSYQDGVRGTTEVTELPIGTWTDKFKELCEDLLNEKKLKSFKNYSNPKDVKFVLTNGSDFDCDVDTLKLFSYLYTSNMVAFNDKEQLKKYDTVDELICDFCEVRYLYYQLRKKHIIGALEKEIRYLGNKERFVQEVIDGELDIMNVEEDDVIAELKSRGYDEDPKKDEGGYDYLLSMQIRTFTADKVRKLKNDIQSNQEKLDEIKKTKESQMWLDDLDEFVDAYKKWLVVIENEKPKVKRGGKKK